MAYSASFCLAQDSGEGIFYTGTRDWRDYRVTIPRFNIGSGSAGIIVRVRGVHRCYAMVFEADGNRVTLVKAKDVDRRRLASCDCKWDLDIAYRVEVQVEGNRISGFVDGKKVLEAEDVEYAGGGMGAVLVDGNVVKDQFDIAPST